MFFIFNSQSNTSVLENISGARAGIWKNSLPFTFIIQYIYIYIYIYIYSMNFLLQWLLTLFSPCYFDLVYNTWNYAPILNTSHSFKNFEKNILALQLFDGVSILNKNSVFFVFCLYYWGFFFLNFFNYLMPRLKQTLFLYLV